MLRHYQFGVNILLEQTALGVLFTTPQLSYHLALSGQHYQEAAVLLVPQTALFKPILIHTVTNVLLLTELYAKILKASRQRVFSNTWPCLYHIKNPKALTQSKSLRWLTLTCMSWRYLFIRSVITLKKHLLLFRDFLIFLLLIVWVFTAACTGQRLQYLILSHRDGNHATVKTLLFKWV